jgi:hypothetical protein
MTSKSCASAGIIKHQAYEVSGPAVHQQQRRPLASDDRVQAQLTGVDIPARVPSNLLMCRAESNGVVSAVS